MSLSKLWTALRGHANEGLEAAADSQAITILDQEMRDAEKELSECNASLTKIMAKRKRTEQSVKSLEAEVEKFSNYAIAADDKGDADTAAECAERVEELEGQLATEQEILAGFQKSEKTLKANIQKASTNIRRFKQQIEQVKATESVQKAQTAVSSRHMGANSKIKTAADSLSRIKEKQAQTAAELEAAEELAEEESGADLESRLKKAGIAPGGKKSGSDKLAELRAKRAAKENQ